MQPDDQRGATPAAASRRSLDPKLERTLIVSGWRPEDLRSPTRSPLANLRAADLATTVMVPSLDPSTAAISGSDPNDTRMASDWSWMDALAAMSGTDPQSTLITPSRPPERDRRPSASADLELTRVAPWSARDLFPIDATLSQSVVAPAQEQAPAQTPPELAQLPPVPEQPALLPGVQLVGTMPDSGFAEQQWLVQRDQQFVQVSELLYRVLEQIDGARTLEEIAANVREATGRPVSANNVRLLIAARLLPLGLVVPADGTPAVAAPSSARSPLAITLRVGFVGPRAIEPFARVLQVLFWPPVLVLVSLLVLGTQVWLYRFHGIATPIRAALSEPLLASLFSIVVLLSALFHELGHASALRYGGGRARGIGFGVYLIFPAFYTDCTDSYRLGRWGRLRTDLGGIYFDLITSLALFALYGVTHQEVILASVFFLDLEILDQFNPAFRYDGYWAVADLIGVPDLYLFALPVLLSLVPERWRGARVQPVAQNAAANTQAPALRGWVKVVFVAYLLLATPFVIGFLFTQILAPAPTYFAGGVEALVAFAGAAMSAHQGGRAFEAGIDVLQGLIVLVGVALLLFGVVMVARYFAATIWRLGKRSLGARVLSLVALAGGIALLAFVWHTQLSALAPQLAQLVGHLPHR